MIVMSLAASSDSTLSNEFKMESYVMSERSKLHVKIFGLCINAEGGLAICVAAVIVLAVLAFYRF